MKTKELLSGLTNTIDNVESGKSCTLCDICHDFLNPKQYYECVNGINLCTKSEMSTKAMLDKIISELENSHK